MITVVLAISATVLAVLEFDTCCTFESEVSVITFLTVSA